MESKLAFLLIVFASFSFISCGAAKKYLEKKAPVFSLREVRVSEIGLENIKIEITASVSNRYFFDINYESIELSLLYDNGEKFAEVEKTPKGIIKKKEQTNITFTINATGEEGAEALRRLWRDSEIRLLIRGKASLTKASLKYDVPIKTETTIKSPLPGNLKIKEVKARSINLLTGKTILDFNFLVKNPPAKQVEKVDYKLYLYNSLVSQSQSNDKEGINVVINEDGSMNILLSVAIDFSKIGALLQNILSGVVDYRLEIIFSMRDDEGNLYTSRSSIEDTLRFR